MKISFDIDGTMTDFSKFVFSAENYFKKKYGMKIVNTKGLEVEDVYDIKNVLISRGYIDKEADIKTKEITDKFWISFRFIKFSLLVRFRKGVRHTIRQLKKCGHELYIDTSRAKTTQNNLIGKIARIFTRWQCILNGVYTKIIFHKDDESKLNEIRSRGIQLLVDDKPAVVNDSSDFTNVICVNTDYNKAFHFPASVTRINGFEHNELGEAMRKLLGDSRYNFTLREAASAKFYRILHKYAAPIVLFKFRPVVFNMDNLIETSEPVIFAPNHRSTLDPIIITSVLGGHIHWAALKRFFDGEDSIFNNRKSYILRKITSRAFKKLEFFPIERIKDNPKANNLQVIKDMNGFLKVGSSLGIFCEGSTNKNPELHDFGEFDDAFLRLAKRNNAWVQPITVLWVKELARREKVIICVGKPFRVGSMSIQESLNLFTEIQEKNLAEAKIYRDSFALI